MSGSDFHKILTIILLVCLSRYWNGFPRFGIDYTTIDMIREDKLTCCVHTHVGNGHH